MPPYWAVLFKERSKMTARVSIKFARKRGQDCLASYATLSSRSLTVNSSCEISQLHRNVQLEYKFFNACQLQTATLCSFDGTAIKQVSHFLAIPTSCSCHIERGHTTSSNHYAAAARLKNLPILIILELMLQRWHLWKTLSGLQEGWKQVLTACNCQSSVSDLNWLGYWGLSWGVKGEGLEGYLLLMPTTFLEQVLYLACSYCIDWVQNWCATAIESWLSMRAAGCNGYSIQGQLTRIKISRDYPTCKLC